MRPLRTRGVGRIRRIADLGGADQLVERDLVGLGDREEQLEAGFPLAGFSRETARTATACSLDRLTP